MSSKSARKGSVIRHRLFPVIVALWCAALFGFASFAVPVSMIERLVAASDLPGIVPAAAPPLGYTARAGIALALAGTGALAGLLLGRRLRNAALSARPAAARPQRAAAPETPAESPAPRFSEPAEEDAPSLTGRRRALSVTDETLPANPVEAAPLPGSPRPYQPLDLAELFQEEASRPHAAEPAVAEEREPQAAPPTAAIVETDPATTITEPTVVAQVEPVAMRSPFPLSPVANAPLETLGVVQLVERLAWAMAEYDRRKPDGALRRVLAPALSGITSDGQAANRETTPVALAPKPIVPEVAAPQPAPAVSVEPAPERQQFVRVEEPSALSATPEPVVIFPGHAPQSPLAAPAAAAPESTRREALPADPAETQRALRAALSTLQRMSSTR